MDLYAELNQHGFAIRRGVLVPRQLDQLCTLLFPPSSTPSSGLAPPHALRNVLWERGGLVEALTRFGIDTLASEALGAPSFAIDALYFDKTSRANWKVPNHQDRMMPVAAEVQEVGFSGWTRRGGVVYVEPPVDVLARLVAIRIHLDDCPALNGSLAVLPGSHCLGKLRDAELTEIDRGRLVECEAKLGDVLVIKPLLVHRSSPARDPEHRRVLHVVYAASEPGTTVRWRRTS